MIIQYNLTIQYNLFFVDLKLKKCVLELLILVLLYFILFLIQIRLTKYVIKLSVIICNYDSYAHALKFVPFPFKTQKMCDDAVDGYPSTTQFVSECNKTQEMYDKSVNTFFVQSVMFLINIKSQKCVMKLLSGGIKMFS